MPGQTVHARRGGPKNTFRYGIDYLLIDPERDEPTPALFSRNRFNLLAVHDRDHGGAREAGEGAAWARRVFAAQGVALGAEARVLLLTQPRFLGYWFNPVSFWLAMEGDDLRAVIAEVNNPFGDRHSYFCANPDLAPITAGDTITSDKVFHVSPFQRIAGKYRFRFDIGTERIAISITLLDGEKGLVATLTGPLVPLSTGGILRASLRRPAGALRTIALIYWQAVKLKLKGARYRTRPAPPKEEVS
ncbi:DUF1365 domain-containing protein [Sinisalibacter lacisalsi]|nr:DUF1365 domain-containing protein [Sinisalibacter lacisalsi]